MLLTLRSLDFLPLLNFNNTIINFVESHKHLDMNLTYNGKWHTHIETILSSAYKMLGVMRKLKYTFSLGCGHIGVDYSGIRCTFLRAREYLKSNIMISVYRVT